MDRRSFFGKAAAGALALVVAPAVFLAARAHGEDKRLADLVWQMKNYPRGAHLGYWITDDPVTGEMVSGPGWDRVMKEDLYKIPGGEVWMSHEHIPMPECEALIEAQWQEARGIFG